MPLKKEMIPEKPAGGVGETSNQLSKVQDLIEVYNAEKLRLDILKSKQSRVLDAFMGSYERCMEVQKKACQVRQELVETESEVGRGKAELLEAGEAFRESEAEMEASVQELKQIGEKNERQSGK